MLTADAIAHFGTRSEIARALAISRAAVSKWGDVVPEGSAYKIESITGGKLKADPSLYPPRSTEAA